VRCFVGFFLAEPLFEFSCCVWPLRERLPASLRSPPPAGLEIRLHSGLTITGAVGSVYSIEYTTSPAVKTSWRCLSFLQLSTPTHLWTDPTPATGPQRFYRATLDVRPNLVFIPPGSFRMGSPSNEVGRLPDEGPQTVVTLTQGFYMARYKVTQTDYQWVVGSYPSVFTGDFNRPVETVSWEDATNYCAQLTRRERAARVIPPNCVYRLPTEAEWEYACRAWTTTRFSYGDDPGYTNLANYAWYVSNSGHTTRAVGEKLPNPWGLYDMHGGALGMVPGLVWSLSGRTRDGPPGANKRHLSGLPWGKLGMSTREMPLRDPRGESRR
jgi:hypothetical protein